MKMKQMPLEGSRAEGLSSEGGAALQQQSVTLSGRAELEQLKEGV